MQERHGGSTLARDLTREELARLLDAVYHFACRASRSVDPEVRNAARNLKGELKKVKIKPG